MCVKIAKSNEWSEKLNSKWDKQCEWWNIQLGKCLYKNNWKKWK